MNFKLGETVSVLTAVGEFVGKFHQSTGGGITLLKPRLLIRSQQGVGFGPGVCMSGQEDPEEVMIYDSSIILVTQTHKEVEKVYIQTTTSIILQ